MTDAIKATVWQATWKPWGGAYALSGTKALNLRFPGQYFQIETGLHYNWHRHYDPVTGRYTQPDPHRFVDGPSVYAYAGSSPYMCIDSLGFGKIGFLVRSVKGAWRYVTKEQAARRLAKGGDVIARGPGASGKAKRLATDQFGGKAARHDGHELPSGRIGRPHYQHQNGGRGHVFYGYVTPFIAYTYVCQYGDNWWTRTLDFFNPWSDAADLDVLING